MLSSELRSISSDAVSNVGGFSSPLTAAVSVHTRTTDTDAFYAYCIIYVGENFHTTLMQASLMVPLFQNI